MSRFGRNDSVSDVNVNDDLSVQLFDHFKAALRAIPENLNSYTCGEMNFCCISCNAKHFESEKTGRQSHVFTLCCHKGKVNLLPISECAFFTELYNDLSSSNSTLKRRSNNSFGNIRKYISAFAMDSSEAKIDESFARGIYQFKIHDVFYHRSGPWA